MADAHATVDRLGARGDKAMCPDEAQRTKKISIGGQPKALKPPSGRRASFMPSSELILGALLAVNAALYGSLGYAVLGRRRRLPEPSNLSEAFGSLEVAVRGAVPGLQPGFTWEEAVARLRSLGVDTGGVEGALGGYEAYRYGGAPLPATDFREVARVAKKLGRRRGSSVGL